MHCYAYSCSHQGHMPQRGATLRAVYVMRRGSEGGGGEGRGGEGRGGGVLSGMANTDAYIQTAGVRGVIGDGPLTGWHPYCCLGSVSGFSECAGRFPTINIHTATQHLLCPVTWCLLYAARVRIWTRHSYVCCTLQQWSIFETAMPLPLQGTVAGLSFLQSATSTVVRAR